MAAPRRRRRLPKFPIAASLSAAALVYLSIALLRNGIAGRADTAPLPEGCETELDLFRTGRGPEQQLARVEAALPGSQNEGAEVAADCISPSGPAVHVQYSSDPSEYLAVLASLHSALRNSRTPGRLRFHLTIPHTDAPANLCARLLAGLNRRSPQYVCPAAALPSYLPAGVVVADCMAASAGGGAAAGSCFCGSAQFHIVQFDPGRFDLPGAAVMGGHEKDRAALLSPMNFARNFADAYLLPLGVRRLVYLDADTIVQGDVAELWGAELAEGQVAGFARSCTLTMRQIFDFEDPFVAAVMQPSDCYINAGVYTLDLQAYRAHGVQRRVAALAAEHAAGRRMWVQGVQQPAFVLGLLGRVAEVDARWNTDALGFNPDKPGRKPISPCVLRSAFVLHWNGVFKPWSCGAGDCYKDYWLPYRLEE